MDLEATARTPQVRFNEDEGYFHIEGRSVQENADAFYAPIQDALSAYFSGAGVHLEMRFRMNYFNTSSSKYFLDLMKTAEEAVAANGAVVSVLWEYDADDLDMKEAGEDYAGLLDIPVRVRPIE